MVFEVGTGGSQPSGDSTVAVAMLMMCNGLVMVLSVVRGHE